MATEDERYNLDQRIDHVTNESLSATRRIRQVAEETNQMGVETLITVNEQGEQLDNVERRLDEINVDMKRTDKHLTELEKCCGCFTCCCRPPDYTKRRDYKQVYGRSRQDEELITEQPTGNGGRGQPQGAFVKRITNDEREEEMEENLGAVSDVLTNLKGIATEMGTELDRQNDQLGRLETKVDVNTGHLSQANRRIRKQL